MAITTLTANLTVQAGWSAANALTGTDYTNSPVSNQGSLQKKVSITTAIADASAGGGDEIHSAIHNISSSSSASVDLTSLVDILQTTGVTLARVKAILIRLLSVADDATNGTAASSVTIDNTVSNGLSAQSHSGWFDNAAEGAANGSKFTIPNGGFVAFGTPSAGGVIVDSTHKIIKITNNDAGLTAAVQITFLGGTA